MTNTSPSSEDTGEGHSKTASVVRRVLPITVLLLAVAAAFLYFREPRGAPERETPGQTAAQALPVSIYTVKKEDIPVRRRFLGRTEASKVVEIRARVAGYLLSRSFEEGTFIEAGQLLFEIDPRPFQNDLARAEAHRASAEATLERARLQVARYTELTKKQSATEGDLEEWQRQEAVAAADVALARAEKAAADLNVEYTRIVAPVSGMIGEAQKEEGSYVDAGSNGLMAVIQQVDPLHVRFSFTEKQMLRWREQEEQGVTVAPPLSETNVQVMLADGSVWPESGRVDYVDPLLDTTTGTAQLRASLPNTKRTLKPGQFVHVEMQGITRVDAIRVPQNVVRMSPTGASVFVVDDESHVQVRPVTLGEWSGKDFWIIEEGLSPGDRVVTTRLLMMRAGMPVQIVEP
ncbi:Multidrug export protein AcrE precursor [Planctomycetes bacterium Poly30]|uniref:Multidrug export protein AcrE n=1 Tax=Saltatorellus ferox TaxID=2528018 RepID=A0A518ERF7_9BACT|nr:Multidrug export protein AcrE precursor [Planctomycetes bacterium Poly30]